MRTLIDSSRAKTTAEKTPTPDKVAAIRRAARLRELESWQRWEAARDECVAHLSTDLGRRYSQDRVTLDKFAIYHDDQRKAVSRVNDVFSSDVEWLMGGAGVVLYGVVGTGKDHLMASIMYHFAELTVPTRWVSGQEIYGRFRDAMDTGERESRLLAEWSKPAILGISDPIPPVGKPSDFNLTQLGRLIDRRYRELRPTLVTLNATSEKDADAKLSAPVFDRLRHRAVMIRCFWPSFRERQ
jgi:DNA replication protein DnaC